MIEKEQVLWQVAGQMTLNLQANAVKLAAVSVADLQKMAAVPGIFAVFYGGRELGLGIGKDGSLSMLYVDDATQLGRHLLDNNTGATGLRRSLAALLAVKYELAAKPRTDDENDVDRFDNYTLEDASEERLTQWMQDNLYLGVVAASEDTIEQLIPAMIASNAPVLNLTNNSNNQYGAEVKRCRKQLASAARLWGQK